MNQNHEENLFLLAVQTGDVEEAERLLLDGIDIHTVDVQFHNLTALHFAAIQGDDNMTGLLLEHGVDVDIGNKWGNTALHYAAENGHNQVVKTLLCYGANPEAKAPGSPFTVLHIAALRGKEETVTILLHYGANINKADNDGIRIPSPLHYACSSKRDTIVKMLLDAGANINARDQHNMTPLHWGWKKESILRILLQYGADITLRDNKDRSVEDMIVTSRIPNRQSLYELLLEYSPVSTILTAS